MKKVITANQANSYVAAGGNICPVCNTTNIAAQELRPEGNVITQVIICSNSECGVKWTDVFKLVSINQQ